MIVKNFLFVLMSICCIFLLSGCRINWFDESFDVSWYVVFIPIVIVFIIVYVFIIKPTYICSKCNAEIKPKWYDFSIVVHFMGKRLIKCPHCKKINFCKIKNFTTDNNKQKKS